MPIKCRKECVSDGLDYKSAANRCVFKIKALKKERRTTTSSGVKWKIKIRIHTMLVVRWLAAQRFTVDATQAANALRSYYKSQHVKMIDWLFLLQHYEFGSIDLDKYKQEFKEEFKYDLEKV